MSETQDPNPGTTPDETPGTALPPDAQPDTPAEAPEQGEEAGEEEAGEAGELPAESAAEEPAQTPSEVAGTSEREIEKAYKTVGRASTTYMRKVAEAMGDAAAELQPCPRCRDKILGFIFPPAMAPPDADTKAEVLRSIGEEPPLASEPDPYARMCDTCAGSGVTLSGSRLNRQKALTCLPCGGRGWVPVGDERRVGRSDILPAENGATMVAQADAVGAGDAQGPDVDIWGRPAGHADYGVHPLYVSQR